eukprot:CAMPEP_0172456132 /NCGR_PEP_ID=MMETSP1065-20121228/14216_1 /TAXON_ID=265537 /ORGANISM="Amphiprora paludosa, Strain CCMP125" /LENGTH=207 /DNA_ID=CAMNT_0013208821 /DNA_START=18 /DNA_END=641 /DNA_ORIENTATION=+
MIALTNDSNHSVSSTVTVDAPYKQPVSVPIAKPQTPSRKVQFNECRNEYFASSTRVAEDCHQTWFTAQDYQEFRATARQAVLDHEQNSFCTILEQVFESVRSVDFVVEEEASTLLTPQLQEQLSQLFKSQEALELIGLESYVAASVKQHTCLRREQIQDVVYDIQSEYLQGLWSMEELEEELMESCLNYSQAACLFAQLLAQAQASA